MNSRRITLAGIVLAGMIMGLVQVATARQGHANSQWIAVKRQTLAIRYRDNDSTAVGMTGSAVAPRAIGKAEVKHQSGRTRIKLEMSNLGNPQTIGPYYTTFVLWAIAPEGQADNLAELPIKARVELDVTTNFQTFGLIITAEPHSAVKLPSPAIVAENTLRQKTEGGIQTSHIEYTGDPGTFYATSWTTSEPSLSADYSTPLLVLGARRAVEIAKRAGAAHHAEPELRDAEIKLSALEQVWPARRRQDQQKYSGAAHDIMRIAENARTQAVERGAQARLTNERRDSALSVSLAQNAADQANRQAATDRDAMNRAQIETVAAHVRTDRAQAETDKAKANEELARSDAARARLDAQAIKQQQAAAQERLYVSLSEILETRREARGLIVNLSDVLFDTNQATLKPGAREKLSKLAGIILAYPGSYRMQIEDHTDSVGSQDHNQKLSENRAAAVHDFLIHAAVPADRIIAVRGFGEVSPTATNNTPEGRQTNRRVEIVIGDTDK